MLTRVQLTVHNCSDVVYWTEYYSRGHRSNFLAGQQQFCYHDTTKTFQTGHHIKIKTVVLGLDSQHQQ